MDEDGWGMEACTGETGEEIEGVTFTVRFKLFPMISINICPASCSANFAPQRICVLLFHVQVFVHL